jgi:hypothetical protein
MSTEKNLQNIMDLMQRDDSVDAPADSIQWASNLFRTRAAAESPSIVKRIAAILQMDLAPNRPAFGERSASISHARQMLFKAEDNAVDLRIEPGKKGFTIHGQVLGDGFAEATVVLSDDVHGFEGRASATSEFRFENIPTGRYELVIRGDSIEVSLKSIDIE